MKGICAPKQKHEFGHTCYNSKALLSIRDNWNKNNPDNTIDTDDPIEIWLNVKELFQNICENEKCWIEQEAIRQGLDRDILNYTFAPNKPKSWKKKEREWLNTTDFEKVFKQYEKSYKNFRFMGASPIDYDSNDTYDSQKVCVFPKLCEFDILKYLKEDVNVIGFIFNLDKHTMEGSHWCCMVLDLRRKQFYYFDSYGQPIPSNMNRLANDIIKQCKKCNINIEFIKLNKRHQYKNSECGIYCIYFIVSILTGKHDYEFFENNHIPDDEIFKYRDVFYS